MFSAILAVLFAIKILASHSQIYRLPNSYNIMKVISAPSISEILIFDILQYHLDKV